MTKTSLWARAAVIAAAALVFSSCGKQPSDDTQADAETENEAAPEPFSHAECNGVYYWRTALTLNDKERAYLADNNVQRAYVRFFDIVPEDSPLSEDAVVPNATLTVRDKLPVSHIVPTIYITDAAIRKMNGSEKAWAEKIVRRVDAMCHYNDIDWSATPEIQLDCDWTASTRDTYFRLCSAVGELLRRKSGAAVSSTIRLHQLREAAPPVDYGVLMLYNTGSFTDPDTDCSILAVDDVKPYLRHLASYPLHLDFAYPGYEWNLVFRDGKFLGILRDELPRGIAKPLGGNRYRLLRDASIGAVELRRGDIVRSERPTPQVVDEVRSLVNQSAPGDRHSEILYHLDSKCLPK